MIDAKSISKTYGNLSVLKNISLKIEKSEFVAIVGSSGAGKSTLLHILGTLDKSEGGSLSLSGKDIYKLSANELAKFRNENIGFVFQFHNLLPEFTALENVCIPAYIMGTSKLVAEKNAMMWLEKLHLSERANHKPSEMSGGEQQRVAVARALINNPKILFADEPSGNLDAQNAAELHQLFADLRKELDLTLVVVTHNKDLAASADRSIQLTANKA